MRKLVRGESQSFNYCETPEFVFLISRSLESIIKKNFFLLFCLEESWFLLGDGRVLDAR